jgi:hypothetical protein
MRENTSRFTFAKESRIRSALVIGCENSSAPMAGWRYQYLQPYLSALPVWIPEGYKGGVKDT